MNINSLFSIDLKLYNILLTPKVWWTSLKNRDAIQAARNNERLKNYEKGKILYICGNGPSLNKVDMRDIKDDYLVVNDFFRYNKKDKIHPPKYYMILDEDYLLSGLMGRYEEVFNPGFETTYIINGVMKKRIDKDYPNLKKIFYFCPWGRLYSNKREIDFTKVHGRPWNVVSEAILFGIYSGYTDIRLLGCDYSVFASNAHFYTTVQKHPKLGSMLYKYCFTTEVHYRIAEYAKNHGVKITNYTKNTLLDAYPIETNSPY